MTMIFHFLAPIKLRSEGSYSISAVKEIKVTDAYLGLQEDVKKCQNVEPFENCTTRKYIDMVQKECKCVPYELTILLGANVVSTAMSLSCLHYIMLMHV